MFNLSLFELTLFAVIALIVLGPEKLPLAARKLGKWYAFALHAKNRLSHNLMNELDLLETQNQIKAELEKLQQARAEFGSKLREIEKTVAANKTELAEMVRGDDGNPSSNPNSPSLGDTSNADIADTNNSVPANLASKPAAARAHHMSTTPLVGHFFLLGDYDKKRRLPRAPMLPNYHAETLLYQTRPDILQQFTAPITKASIAENTVDNNTADGMDDTQGDPANSNPSDARAKPPGSPPIPKPRPPKAKATPKRLKE